MQYNARLAFVVVFTGLGVWITLRGFGIGSTAAVLTSIGFAVVMALGLLVRRGCLIRALQVASWAV